MTLYTNPILKSLVNGEWTSAKLRAWNVITAGPIVRPSLLAKDSIIETKKRYLG